MLPGDASSQDPQAQNPYIANNLKVCIAGLGTSQADAVICKYLYRCNCRAVKLKPTTAKSSGWEAWQAILELVKNLSEVILSNLPSFWRIGKSYMEGKFNKVTKVL